MKRSKYMQDLLEKQQANEPQNTPDTITGSEEKKEKERPGGELVRALAVLVSSPGRLVDGVFRVVSKVIDVLATLLHLAYTVALVAGVYCVAVWICYQLHPAGVPYLIVDGRHVLLPFGKQILGWVAKFHIV